MPTWQQIFVKTTLCLTLAVFISSGVSQQKRRGELQQGGQPGEGLRGQIQARPQEMKPRPAAGVALPSQTHSAAQVQFPLAGIRPPN